MPSQQKSILAQSLGVNLVQNPGKYLGVNFKLRANRIGDFQDLSTKFLENSMDGRLNSSHMQEG